MSKTFVFAGACVCALVLSGCGSESPSAPTQSQLNVSGTWTGSINDNLTGSGTARTTLSQSGNTITGTWSTAAPGATNGGTVSGSSSGNNVSLMLTPSDTRTCGFSVTAIVSNSRTLSGTYAAVSCTVAVNGTINLTKQ